MDTYVDERDYKHLETDKYTFFVLKKIMGGECNLLLSDHERLILCFTGHPFPVWIWTSDDAAEEEMEKAYQLAKEKKLLTGEYHFNIKYSLAEYFIRRATEEGSELKGKATYEQIKDYVREQMGFRVSTLYISQVNRKCGLEVGESYNKPKSEDARQLLCTPEKEEAIMQALRHYGVI